MKPTVFKRSDLAEHLKVANLREISRRTGVAHQTLARIRDGGEIKASALERVSVFYLQFFDDAA